MSEKPNISERVRILRAKRQWTQQQLADAMGYDRNYISMVEGGREPGKKFERQFALLESSPIGDSLTSEHALRVADEIDADQTYGSGPRSMLKRRREELNLSPEDLAKKAGVPAGYIRQIESGDVQGSNEKHLRKLATALDLDPEELLAGSDHPPIVGEHRKTFGAKPDVGLTGGVKAKTIPLISMAQAGELVSYEDVYDYEGVIAFDGKDPRAFAVRIRGDSMAPHYTEGTIAVCYPSRRPKNDNLVIAKLRDGSVLFKRLQIGDGELTLHSSNPNYKPMTYPERDIVWILSGRSHSKSRVMKPLSIILAVALLAPCALAERIEGQVFIVTNGHQTVKLALVQVAAYDAKTVRTVAGEFVRSDVRVANDFIDKVEKPISATCDDIRKKFAAFSKKPGAQLTANYVVSRSLRDSCSELHGDALATMSWFLSAPRFFERLPAPAASTKTDADGNFTIDIPNPDQMFLVAATTREVFSQTERYHWLVPLGTANSRILLSNDNMTTASNEDLLKMSEPNGSFHDAAALNGRLEVLKAKLQKLLPAR